MKMLFIGTHGLESATHTVLPFLEAQAAVEEGHEVDLLLMGDAVVLMKAAVARNTIGVGWPAVADIFSSSSIRCRSMSDEAVPSPVR